MESSLEQLSTTKILSAVSHLSLPELEQVFDRVLALQAERKAAHLSKEESVLLSRVNQGLPEDLRVRLTLLRTKREEESIPDEEYEELTKLTDRAEELHADRMTALVELAKLRGVSLPVVMEQLGIQFPEHV
ncbi:MAG: STAS/SEC14 domain-containing protein [Deltaproteobacteria bacterium]|nr:STAS/SEC14 domain-containing protein [Deltaproteobacteria bacterium]